MLRSANSNAYAVAAPDSYANADRNVNAYAIAYSELRARLRIAVTHPDSYAADH